MKKQNVEPDKEIVIRLITFIRETAVINPDKIILVVSHGGIMRATMVHLGVGTYESLQKVSIPNTAYIQLQSDGIEFKVKETYGIDLPKN